MQAVVVSRFGGPEVLELKKLPSPVAEPGGVVVEVVAVDVIGLDTAIRAGLGTMFGIAPPYVSGDGFAGTVTAVGEGVDATWQGRRVAVATGVQGAAAELVSVSVPALVPVPDDLSLETAAALVHDGRTARALLETARPQPGERVVVMPAASGLGLVLIQLLRATGAEIVTVAGGPAKLAAAKEHGGDVLLDYTADGWAEELGAVDVVLDGVGGGAAEAAFAALRRGGRFLSYGDASGTYAAPDPQAAQGRRISLHGPEVVHLGGTAQTQHLTRRAFADAVAGHIRPLVAGCHPWDRAADAHRAQELRASIGRQLLLRT